MGNLYYNGSPSFFFHLGAKFFRTILNRAQNGEKIDIFELQNSCNFVLCVKKWSFCPVYMVDMLGEIVTTLEKRNFISKRIWMGSKLCNGSKSGPGPYTVGNFTDFVMSQKVGILLTVP